MRRAARIWAIGIAALAAATVASLAFQCSGRAGPPADGPGVRAYEPTQPDPVLQGSMARASAAGPGESAPSPEPREASLGVQKTRVLVLTAHGVPVPGARVSLLSIDHKPLGVWTTDESGMIPEVDVQSLFMIDVQSDHGIGPCLPQRPGGTVVVNLAAMSFLLTIRAFDDTSGRELDEFDVLYREEHPWEPGAGAALHGSSEPASRALWRVTTRSAASGSITLPVGNLDRRAVVELTARGYGQQWAAIERIDGRSVRAHIREQAWETLRNDALRVPMRRSQALTGRVIDGQSGEPIEGVLVALGDNRTGLGRWSGSRREVYTDADGRYLVEQIYADNESVAFMHPRYMASFAGVDVLRGSGHGIVRLDAGIPVVLRIEASDGSPAARASVELAFFAGVRAGVEPPWTGPRTAEAAWGRYEADDGGNLAVHARREAHMAGAIRQPGHARELFVICAERLNESTPEFVVRLRQAAAQAIRIVDASGGPLAGRIVRVGWIPRFLQTQASMRMGAGCRGVDIVEWAVRPVVPGWTIPTAVTDGNGWSYFGELPVGPNQFTAYTSDGSPFGEGRIVVDGVPMQLTTSGERDSSGVMRFTER